MSDVAKEIAELRELCWAQQAGELSPEAASRLETLVVGNPVLCEYYLSYIGLFAAVEWAATPHDELPHSRQTPEVVNLVIPSAPVSPSPAFFDFLGERTQNTIAYWTQGWPLAYLVATVLFAVGLLIGSQVPLSFSPTEMAQHGSSSAGSTRDKLDSTPAAIAKTVGRVSDLADCQWADAEMVVAADQEIYAGGWLRLESGVFEITYSTGAKVILQGPARFEPAANGGFLTLGRLTGNVEGAKKASTSASSAGVAFAIRTPKAVITDLGTEFGVEVDPAGRTISHVYRGSVEVQRIGSHDGETKLTLREGEAVSVADDRDGRPRMSRIDGVPGMFVRRISGKRVRIPVFGTGLATIGLRGDAHWQWVARSDDPGFQPQSAAIVAFPRSDWTPRGERYPEKEEHSDKWISTDSVWASAVPPGTVCTFRTTFVLEESLVKHAHLQGVVRADKCVRSMRLNGQTIPFKAADGKFRWEGGVSLGGTTFTIDQGFLAGNNALEIDVEADVGEQSELDELRVAGADVRSAVGLCVIMEGWGQSPQPSKTQNRR